MATILNRVNLSAMPQASHLSSPASAITHTPSQSRPVALRVGRAPRLGLIHNARARHNIGRDLPLVIAGCDRVIPQSLDELRAVLASFVVRGIDTLIIDGGDGTVRDVMSIMARYFPRFRPRIAILPSGKTNALALDLGIPLRWTLKQAADAIIDGHIAERAPIEVWRDGARQADLSGFIFGAGAFVRATQTAQKAHQIGAFNGMAVGLSIAAAVGQTVFGKPDNVWRRGEDMRITLNTDRVIEGAQYLVLASTLGRMPLGIKPFGRERTGLKLLRIEAPASHVLQALPAILGGAEWAWLRRAGYHREDARHIDLSLANDFVLDGEIFPGGDLTLRPGAPISFIVP